MFPTSHSTIIRNEDGEPMGFETTAYDEPEYNPDDYLADWDTDDRDVWGDPDACEAMGDHGQSLNKTNEGTWECAACGETVEHTDPWEESPEDITRRLQALADDRAAKQRADIAAQVN